MSDEGSTATSTAATATAPARPDDDDSDGGVLGFVKELPVLILIAFVLAFLLRTFVVQVFYIPSSSMEPTLLVNDRILVDKVTYRFRDLRRGEIIVFEGPDSGFSAPESGNVVVRVLRGVGRLIGLTPVNARDYVKRVIGLPGDEVRIDTRGRVFVNGEQLPEAYVVHPDRREFNDGEPVTVPDGQLFFLGDNRSNSSDSRSTLGYVDADNVVGRAFLIIWPVERAQRLRPPEYPAVPETTVSAPAGGRLLPAA